MLSIIPYISGMNDTLTKAHRRRMLSAYYVRCKCYDKGIDVEYRARGNAYYVILFDYMNVRTDVFVSSNADNVWVKARYFLEKSK